MGVRYSNYRDIDVDEFDAVVVGSGFAGSVVAHELAQRGDMSVLVIEKRKHIAGNMYDEYDDAGVLVHRFGPHVFHTNNRRVFNYLSQFTDWIDYRHRVLADWYGTYLPVPFNKESIELVFGEMRAARIIEKLISTFGDECQVTLDELRSQNDSDLSELSDFIYENIFLHFTVKQWGVTPDEVDPSVINRVPISISYDDHCFQDVYQGMPSLGYTAMFEKILGHKNIEVCLETDAESVFDLDFTDNSEDAKLSSIKLHDKKFTNPIIYTGPLDELFLARFGRLPYRSIDFVYETFDEEYKLPCATVNYTVSEDYTRMTEFKHMTAQKIDRTTLCKEYACAYTDPSKQTPYYAVISDENYAHYERYRALTDSLPNFYPIGRLALYRYYNMDEVVSMALDLSDEILAKRKNLPGQTYQRLSREGDIS